MAEDVRPTIAVVGLHFGRHMLESEIAVGAGAEHFRLAGVCSMERDLTEMYAGKYQVKAFHTLEALAADEGIGAVALFCGPNVRAKLIGQLIRAGKHVITTKPFENDPAAALAVLREAKELGRAVHVNSPGPVPTGDLRQIIDWQREFGLGRAIGCRADTWVRYNEKADGSWYDDAEKCPAPPIFRLGIYPINDLVRFFGPAESVQLTQSRLFTGRPTADNAQLTILFKNGGIVSVFASFCVADEEHYKNALTLNFENGTVYRNAGPLDEKVDRSQAQMAVVTKGAGEAGGAAKAVRRATPHGASGGYNWEAFAKSIRGEALADETTAEQIVEGIRIVQAMTRAQRTGRTEAVG